MKKTINSILAENTGKPLEQIEADTQRDFFLSPKEALEYGLIDKILTRDNKNG
jgi:ATP-dependent Clp protease protease subunit